jgi:hypothetical protein
MARIITRFSVTLCGLVYCCVRSTALTLGEATCVTACYSNYNNASTSREQLQCNLGEGGPAAMGVGKES